ncbi:hypothetical protein AKJ37_04895 [candidate division MSBL1 archaeon SCGC-AAA259I09]|uniref:Uncharacterized protein n=2 Tax=candidate division MSBL1 TaxID=215777 RepID=A0A133UR18_9EURY|nr:hypothetical protein AKJ37_04895 [candidate division MSBL1 archaeon SCGC-AAA259I09]KXA97015.1 hypothetical protein AKJ39_03815 [candidate division MSBL1 archaeon SCGC-AAA259J03]
MPYAPFHEKFPRVAEEETRSIIAPSHSKLPKGKYVLVELFCDEPDCDCRRVFFDVFYEEKKKSVAVVAYGWEDREFYENWSSKNDPEIIDDLKGPALNKASPQSKLAPRVLELIEQVLKDNQYVERIKRHYHLFKEQIEKDEKTYR